MPNTTVYCPGMTAASVCAAEILENAGWTVFRSGDTYGRRILLDIPSFGPGRLDNPEIFAASLPAGSIVYGGNLSHPALEAFQCVDFLQDPWYLAENAAITARCAMQIPDGFTIEDYQNLPVLVIGWGRIGKCLSKLLRDAGANVTVSARNPSDLAILQALGYDAVDTAVAADLSHQFRIIFNTVPAPVLPERNHADNRIRIDLASKRGIQGDDVLWARGLPGKYAPRHSGMLIAKTFLRLVKEEK